jgi:hypothetical protein
MDGWSRKRTHKTVEGVKEFYYCNKDLENCNLRAYLLYKNNFFYSKT